MKQLQPLLKTLQQYGGLIVIWVLVFCGTVFLVNIGLQNWLLKH